MGTRAFKYAAGVTQEADGSFTLKISSVGPKGSHCMPAPPAFASEDLDTLVKESKAFLAAWAKAQPEANSHVLCCSKVVENAITRARKSPMRTRGPGEPAVVMQTRGAAGRERMAQSRGPVARKS